MRQIFVVFGLLVLLQSCSEADDDNQYADSVCEKITKVDPVRYKNNESQGFRIRSVQVKGDCLEVEIESGGCNGDTWKVDLVDAGWVMESVPEQRSLKIFLENEELCNAIVIKTYTFDLRPSRANNDVVLLNLEHWEELIRYEY